MQLLVRLPHEAAAAAATRHTGPPMRQVHMEVAVRVAPVHKLPNSAPLE